MNSTDTSRRQPPLPAKTNTADQATVKDPICGMTVDPETAKAAGLTVVTQGKTFYFCSQECVDEFHRHGPQNSGPASFPTDVRRNAGLRSTPS